MDQKPGLVALGLISLLSVLAAPAIASGHEGTASVDEIGRYVPAGK